MHFGKLSANYRDSDLQMISRAPSSTAVVYAHVSFASMGHPAVFREIVRQTCATLILLFSFICNLFSDIGLEIFKDVTPFFGSYSGFAECVGDDALSRT